MKRWRVYCDEAFHEWSVWCHGYLDKSLDPGREGGREGRCGMRDVVVLLAWNSCFYCWIFYFSAPRWCFVSHTTIHVLYWFAPPFLQTKKNQKSTCLNKNISMFKAPCCCVMIKRSRASPSLLSTSLRLFDTLNTLAGLNLFTSSWAAGTCQTKEEMSGGGRKKKKTKLYWHRFSVGEQQSELPSVNDTCWGTGRRGETFEITGWLTDTDKAPQPLLRFPAEHVDVSDVTNS